jgi:two-component system LytT family response regulator
VLVDDERLARDNLRALLREQRHLAVVAEADGLEAALAVIAAHRPDLVFLDIQMPGGSGFDLLQRLHDPLAVIFVTAYDRYAIRAFEVNALDYLLKPVDPARLETALARVLAPAPLPAAPAPAWTMADSVFLDTGRKRCFVPLSAVCAVCAERDYTRVHTAAGEALLVRRTLKSWQTALPPGFLRIHRNSIISLDHLHSVERRNGGLVAVVRGCPDALPVSRRMAPKLQRRLETPPPAPR